MKFKTILYILSIALLFSCEIKSNDAKISNDIESLELLKKEITSGKELVQFDSLMQFEWESLIILTPYSLPKKVGEKYNIDLTSIEHFAIESRDDINLIVFLKNNIPTRVIAYPRYPGDFSDNVIEVIRKTEANYSIELTNETSVEGNQWIRLTKK